MIHITEWWAEKISGKKSLQKKSWWGKTADNQAVPQQGT
jgi:hypothetical protein